MAYNFTKCDRDQMFLLPPSLQDWLPPNHLAWFLIDAIKQMNLSPFMAAYREDGRGQKAHNPEVLIPVLLYGYCHGERSSRQLERLCQENVAYRVLAANTQPDHCAFARFRRRHQKALHGMFVEILRLCNEAGVLKLGTVALDGTKMKANAALAANKTEKGLQEEIDRILKEAESRDSEEDSKYGRDRRGDELPEDLRDRESRLKRLRECKERLEKEKAEIVVTQEEKIQKREAEEEATGQKKRGRKPKPPEEMDLPEGKANVTDPESRVMKSSKGFVQGFNAQAVVTEDQFIIAPKVVQDENDQNQLHGMLAEAEKNVAAVEVGEAIGACLADAGYCSEKNLAVADPEGPELFIATQKDRKLRKELRDERYPRGRLPAGISRTAKMERKLRTKRGKGMYRKRSQTVEPVFGQIKDCRGIDRFLLRGLDGCQCEWSLICATHNLLKLWRWTEAGLN